MLTNPWLAAGAVVGLLVAMLAALEGLRRGVGLHPEIARKGAHIGLGIVTSSFPFLFDEVWPVAIIGLVIVVSLASVRWIPALRTHAGQVVHGVGRRSGGELYFPIAATILFIVADGDAVLYLIPLLTLAFADAVAAMVGIWYGRIRYAAGDGHKSVEGSLAFFAVAFLTTHLPLLLLTDIGRLESVLIAVVFGMVMMLLEAISHRGTDNLLIPFGGYLLLAGLLQRPASGLVAAVIVALLVLGLVLALHRRRTLSDSTVSAAVLFGFALCAGASLPGLIALPSTAGLP